MDALGGVMGVYSLKSVTVRLYSIAPFWRYRTAEGMLNLAVAPQEGLASPQKKHPLWKGGLDRWLPRTRLCLVNFPT